MPIRFMRVTIQGMALALILLASPAMAASPVLGGQKYFKDWAVGCDNGSACRAVALMRRDDGDNWLAVTVARGMTMETPLSIAVSPRNNDKGPFQLRVDRRAILSGDLRDEFDAAEIKGRDADKLIRAMLRGQELRFHNNANDEMASASLSGLSAALRYMDAQQGRTGSKDALVAKGRKLYRPAVFSTSSVTVQRIGTAVNLPDITESVALAEQSICRQTRNGITEDYSYSLGRHAGQNGALMLLGCGGDDVNTSIAVYIGTQTDGKKWQFVPATFDYRTVVPDETAAVPLLRNVHWDQDKQILSSFTKGRSLGDCGTAEDYVWDGSSFRLVRATTMDECRGARDWLPRWTAALVYAD